MGELNLNNAEASNLTAAITDFSVDEKDTDGATGSVGTWTNTKWAQYFGYYKTIPELRAVIDAKATWSVGKGFKMNNYTKMVVSRLGGFGKDSFNTIIENMLRTMNLAGDSYAEIIRNDDNDLINLKPLNPGRMELKYNEKGIIIKYNYKGKKDIPLEPEEVFHLSRNRTADEIHGISLVESLEWIILAKREVETIFKTIMQRHIKPVMIFHLDTDDTTKIANFKSKMDKAYADGENLYIPKDAVVPEVLAVSPNATLNPMAWLEYLNKQFYQAAQTPQIIVGGSSEFVEKATSVVYLAFEQNVKEDQLYLKEQVGKQLGLTIEPEFPASLQNELISDDSKDGEVNIDPNLAGVGQGQ